MNTETKGGRADTWRILIKTEQEAERSVTAIDS